MIPRYTTNEMASIWAPENKFKHWLAIEAAAAEAMEANGSIPKGTAQGIQTATIDVARIEDIERETRHDVIAFLTSISEQIGKAGKHLHYGMTSSDIVDTGFSMLLRDSGKQILNRLDTVLAALKKQAQTHKKTICIGRSHGIHAEPTSFGLKMAGHYAAFMRCRERLKQAINEISVCAISGPVGTHATCPPDVQAHVAKALNLTPETISTQIIPRDRHAVFFSTFGIIAGCIDNLATEIRHLQRSEVREVEEYFHGRQKGSSAMPHKRNPVLSENLSGLARLIRSAVTPALENITLWHERDISHSSVERTILPDAIMASDFALKRLAEVMDTLIVYPDRMRENLDALGGLIYSQRVLLAMTDAGLNREEAYEIVQDNAMKLWDAGCNGEFLDYLRSDERVSSRLGDDELSSLFNPQDYLTHIAALIEHAIESS